MIHPQPSGYTGNRDGMDLNNRYNFFAHGRRYLVLILEDLLLLLVLLPALLY